MKTLLFSLGGGSVVESKAGERVVLLLPLVPVQYWCGGCAGGRVELCSFCPAGRGGCATAV